VPFPKENPPRIILNNPLMSSEDIDRTYGNSPYYFYANAIEENEGGDK
jgi:hypothetical protein